MTVTEQAARDAGTDGAVTVCSNGTPVDLFAELGGTPDAGGTWSGPSAVAGGMYDPAAMAPGAYVYTVNGAAPCGNATATVTVTEQAAPNAGTDASITICSSNSTTNLFFTLSGAQFGGTWVGPNGLFNGNYEPGIDPPGDYVYTVAGIAPCIDDQATVTVIEVTAPHAGQDSALTVCSDGGPVDLFPLLGNAQVGGTWAGGFSGTYVPGTTGAGSFTYSMPAVPPCLGDQATITVNEVPAPDAGSDGALTVCDQGAATSLFNALGGAPDAGGAWSGPSPVAGGMYDPATMTPGAYVYTVTGTAPCGVASATVTVAETGSPDAGSDGAVTVCSDGTPIDLFASLGSTPDAGGTWGGGLVNGMFDPAVNAAGTYTYTLDATPPCLAAQSEVVVTVVAAPDAGSDGTLTVCDQGSAVDLFSSLGGTPDAGGAWSGPSPVAGGMYDPATMTPGAYVYTVTGMAPCGVASATVTVAETGSPVAGSDGAVTVCSDGTPIDLFASLGGTPDAGGTWGGGLVNGMFDP
ncbi:MAG: hypothetical protein J5I62_15215, partial [Flavobacteriales bacterium]|nr:hypothetical protein [Flavobacteriales bacterium]